MGKEVNRSALKKKDSGFTAGNINTTALKP